MQQFNMSLPASVTLALDRLESFGHEAYVVGGAVRDAMLGRPLNDYDVTTLASPEEIKAVFADFHTILTGEKHGTVTVVVDSMPIEITTYRLDVKSIVPFAPVSGSALPVLFSMSVVIAPVATTP